MISWFEKNYEVSWGITIIIALAIFYISTLSFGAGGGTGIGLKSITYHFLAFFFFALFLLISIIRGRFVALGFFVLLIAFLYGVSDEIHQIFVPNRFFDFADIFYNTLGIMFAFLIYLISIEYRRK